MSNAFRLIAIAVLIAALGMFARAASAAPVATTGRPLAPAVAFAPAAQTHLVVWAEDRGLGTGLDLYSVRATASGIVVAGEVPLVVAPGDQSDPAVAYNSRLGEFLVIYTNSGGPGVTPTPGIPVPGTPGGGGTPPPFPTPPGPPLASPIQPAPGGAAGWIAFDPARAGAYASPPPIPTTLQTATPPTPSTPPSFPTPGNPPTSLPPPAGTPTPAVPPPSSAPGPRDLYGVWVSEGGWAITGSFPVIASPADETFPSLAYRAAPGADQWVLAWRDVTGVDVALRNVELAGFGRTLVYASATNTILAGAQPGRPSVTANPSGEFLVVWSQGKAGQPDRDVLGRRLNQNAFPYGPLLSIVDGDADQVYPSVAGLQDTGDYLVAWEERAAGKPPDIRIRRLNRNGIPLRAAYDLASGPPFSFAPALPSTDRSTLLLVWLDRNPASDHSVMGAEVTREGRRIGPERIIVRGGAGPAGVTPVVPPPGFPTPPGPPPP